MAERLVPEEQLVGGSVERRGCLQQRHVAEAGVVDPACVGRQQARADRPHDVGVERNGPERDERGREDRRPDRPAREEGPEADRGAEQRQRAREQRDGE